MTQYQLLQATPMLQKLSQYKLPIKTVYALYNLMKKAEECRAFFVEQEQKLVKEFNGTVNEEGKISFDNQENFKEFVAKYNELKSLEVDAAAVALKISDLGDQTITVADMAALDGVINFEE